MNDTQSDNGEAHRVFNFHTSIHGFCYAVHSSFLELSKATQDLLQTFFSLHLLHHSTDHHSRPLHICQHLMSFHTCAAHKFQHHRTLHHSIPVWCLMARAAGFVAEQGGRSLQGFLKILIHLYYGIN